MSAILVDMDGVIADLEALFWPQFHELHPTAPQIARAERFVFYIEDQIGYEWEPAIDQIMSSEGFFRNLPPVEGAIEGFKQLREDHDVWICTAPITSPTCMAEKWLWIERHFGEDQTKKMFIAKDKTFIRGDFLIDDRPEVKGEFRPPTWQHVYYDQPYNRGVPGKARMTWAEYLNGDVEFRETLFIRKIPKVAS